MKTKLLIITHVITLTALITILYRHHGHAYAQRLGLVKRSEYNYIQNPVYSERMNHFTGLPAKGKIVMLGNSLVHRMSWNELLGRCDVINRGISSDITKGMINRLQDVISAEPEIVFIEGGINDLAVGIPNDTIVSNIIRIVSELKKVGITPVVNEICYVVDGYPNGESMNKRAAEINLILRELAADMDFCTIDLNKTLSNGSSLLPQYALSDRIHFTIDAYKVWKLEIEKHLQ